MPPSTAATHRFRTQIMSSTSRIRIDRMRNFMHVSRMIKPPVAPNVRKNIYHLPDPATLPHFLTTVRAGWLDSAPGERVARDYCEGDDILYCLSGKGRVQVAEQSTPISPGQLIWIPGEIAHSHLADTEDPWSVMWFRLKGTELSALRKRILGGAGLRRTIGNGPELVKWFQTLFRILERPRADTDIRLNAALGRFLEILTAHDTLDLRSELPDSLDRLMHQILERPADRWSTDDMCKIAHMSASQIRRQFNRHFGLSPRAFLRNQRLIKGQRLMEQSSMNLQQIAQACGFCDAFHFSREFKRVTGQSPSRWRKTQRSI